MQDQLGGNEELILKGTFEGVRTFESFTVLQVADEVVSLVAQTVAALRGVRIEWLGYWRYIQSLRPPYPD